MSEHLDSKGSRAPSRVVPALVIGLSIGWLMGLSVSQTVSATIAALMALVGGIGAGLYGRSRDPESPLIDLWPIALIALGVAVGASAGVYARTHQWLGATKEVQTDARKETEATSEAKRPAYLGVLFGKSQDRCSALRAAADVSATNLRKELAIQFPGSGVLFRSDVGSDPIVMAFLEDLCFLETN